MIFIYLFFIIIKFKRVHLLTNQSPPFVAISSVANGITPSTCIIHYMYCTVLVPPLRNRPLRRHVLYIITILYTVYYILYILVLYISYNYILYIVSWEVLKIVIKREPCLRDNGDVGPVEGHPLWLHFQSFVL